jgi:hypothetical protein
MTTTTDQLELEEMEALMDEMRITIKNLASMATAHGLMDPYVNRNLHDAIEGGVNTKPQEALSILKKVNEGLIPDRAFLHLG